MHKSGEFYTDVNYSSSICSLDKPLHFLFSYQIFGVFSFFPTLDLLVFGLFVYITDIYHMFIENF